MVKRKVHIDVNSVQFRRGVKEEYREHPWVGMKGAKKITTDHLKKHPYMYMK